MDQTNNLQLGTKKIEAPLQVAVSCHDLFDLVSAQSQSDSTPLSQGTAFSFVKAVQAVNNRLISLNTNETLLFKIVLLGKDCEDATRSKIAESAAFYGLDISKSSFCSTTDFITTLQENPVKLFLSTDRDDVRGATQAGVPAALLYKQKDEQALDQLKILFSGDLLGLPMDSTDFLEDFGYSDDQLQSLKAMKSCIKEFALLIGEMVRKIGHKDSPLHTSLMTAYGSRDVSVTALKTLRGWGVDVDEAYCLAGAPHSLILSVLQPHILWEDELLAMTGAH